MSSLASAESVLIDAKAFIEKELAPRAGSFDKEGAVPMDFIRAMASHGYLAASIPTVYGGLGLSQLAYGRLTALFGQVCQATRTLMTVHTSLVSEAVLRFGRMDQKKQWLPRLARGEIIAAFALSEPAQGSDARHIQTRWHMEGETILLNGVKKWISFGDLADVFLVVAQCDGRCTAFLVERSAPGVKTIRIEDTMAGRATYLAEVTFDDVIIDRSQILGRMHMGFEYVVSSALDAGRYSVAWGGLSIAQAALQAMVTYAKQREQFGQCLQQFQLIRGMVGDAVTKVHCLEAQCVKAGTMRDQRDPSAAMETTIAKYAGSKIAVDVVGDALQVHGANGFTSAYLVERLYREAKVLEIIEGSSQMQQEMIASYGFNAYDVSHRPTRQS